VYIPKADGGKDRSEFRRWKTKSSACGGRGVERYLRNRLLGFSYGFRPGEASIKRWMRCTRDADEESELGADLDIKSFLMGFPTIGW